MLILHMIITDGYMTGEIYRGRVSMNQRSRHAVFFVTAPPFFTDFMGNPFALCLFLLPQVSAYQQNLTGNQDNRQHRVHRVDGP